MHEPDQHIIQGRLADFEKRCRENGLKMTHQRLTIYRELLSSRDHPAVETIFQRVRRHIPTISIDTVYRTLATLEEAGMINRVDTTEGLVRYEADRGIPHHHLICMKCHQIRDFIWDAFDTLPRPPEVDRWGQSVARNVVITGICRQCYEQAEKK
ncbi:Fur family transcriptional regulator [Desulfurivibrio dismutans]|uniref:Fur family transcriptional regulator n=1 Tax=Desulfurivibrio dismutans TaxID=1398908 RepID=UPI0023D98FEE|nr:Fur family transcriptional regulator [Desulfurivibrio alkaliphilus]MDF1614493.1 Fur family transcriptional regulator [Desulfurivibrio alkaliphilus]